MYLATYAKLIKSSFWQLDLAFIRSKHTFLNKMWKFYLPSRVLFKFGVVL